MSKRALSASSGDTLRVVAIDPIHLARTPKQVKGLSPDELKRRFDYNMSKGRFLKFNGSSFVFMTSTI